LSFANSKVEVSIYQKPKKSNYYCGDSYFYKETENGFICALADGLGSGQYANESSEIVISIIKKNTDAEVEQIITKANEQLIGKRGVVLGILKMDFTQRSYTFSSIGNIGILQIIRGKKKRSIPNAGYLGGFKRPYKVIRGKLESDSNFIMFSDGVLDMELSKLSVENKKDVESITKAYKFISEETRSDDTTLIAMHYNDA
jgi:phosphoserine phosphatase RsbX